MSAKINSKDKDILTPVFPDCESIYFCSLAAEASCCYKGEIEVWYGMDGMVP